jgi:hypothetical protein
MIDSKANWLNRFVQNPETKVISTHGRSLS